MEALLSFGEAAWCPAVRLELWNGARGAGERAVLSEMEKDLESLEIGSVVWDQSAGLARAARERGIAVPAMDLLIAACALHHGVAIEHNDAHFELIAELAP